MSPETEGSCGGQQGLDVLGGVLAQIPFRSRDKYDSHVSLQGMCRKYLKDDLIVEFRHYSLATLQSTRVCGRTRALLEEIRLAGAGAGAGAGALCRCITWNNLRT